MTNRRCIFIGKRSNVVWLCERVILRVCEPYFTDTCIVPLICGIACSAVIIFSEYRRDVKGSIYVDRDRIVRNSAKLLNSAMNIPLPAGLNASVFIKRPVTTPLEWSCKSSRTSYRLSSSCPAAPSLSINAPASLLKTSEVPSQIYQNSA